MSPRDGYLATCGKCKYRYTHTYKYTIKLPTLTLSLTHLPHPLHRPLTYYESVTTKLLSHNITHVAIVTNHYHRPSYYAANSTEAKKWIQNSVKYMEEFISFFQSKGFVVVVNVSTTATAGGSNGSNGSNGEVVSTIHRRKAAAIASIYSSTTSTSTDIDDDFIQMFDADYLVMGGGGFHRIAADMRVYEATHIRKHLLAGKYKYKYKYKYTTVISLLTCPTVVTVTTVATVLLLLPGDDVQPATPTGFSRP